MKKITKGYESFHNYYTQIYGDRWKDILKSLYETNPTVAIPQDIDKNNKKYSSHTADPYYIDCASFFIATVIYASIMEHKHYAILDMCASPGGKLLALLHLLTKTATTSSSISLVANDKSKERYHRLKRNINQFYHEFVQLNSLLNPTRLTITNKDASIFGRDYKNSFNCIILDSPCTNDRHVFHLPREIQEWSPTRCVRMSHTQTKLLCAAIDACVVGGVVFYITCSFSPQENEQVIARVIKKRNVHIVTPAPFTMGHTVCTLEHRAYGHIILPDTSQFAGPLYFCIIKKEDNTTH